MTTPVAKTHAFSQLAAPTYNEAAIRAHVGLLHARAEGASGVFVVSAFHADPENPSSKEDRPGVVTHHRVREVDGMVAAIMAHSETPSLNVYCGLHLMSPKLGRGKRGGRADIVAVLALVADMDADTGKAGELPCKPSFVVETSPGNRQPVWLFASPVTPQEAAPLAAALRRATDSDDGTSDIAHIWRIAGTLNWPNGAKIARGRDPQPVAVGLAESFQGLVYEPAALSDVLAPHMRPHGASESAKASGEPRDASALYGRLSARGAEKLEADLVEGERSEHAARVYEQLSFDGLDLDDAIALVREYGGTWKARYQSDEAMVKDAERIWSKHCHHAQERAEHKAAAEVFLGAAAANQNEPPAEDDDPAEETAGPWFTFAADDQDPFDFSVAKGLIAQIARWVYERSFLPVPEYSTLAALAIGCGIFGRRYVTPTQLGLNLYLIGLAKTSGGKDDPLSSPALLFSGCGLARLIGPGDVTSDGAIETALRHNPCIVSSIDEVGIFFQGVSSKKASTHETKIRKVLLELFTKSKRDVIWTGKGYSDPSERLPPRPPVKSPTLSILGVSVAEEFYAGMSARNIKDGVFGRMTVIKAAKPGERNPNLKSGIPEELRDAVNSAAGNALPIIISAENDPEQKVVPWSASAEALWKLIDDHVRAMGRADSVFADVAGRGAAQTLIIATLRALGRTPTPVLARITRSDIEWGWAIVQRSLNTIQEGILDHLADSEFEVLWKAIRGHVVAAGAKGIAKSTLLRMKGVSQAEPRLFDAAIKWLGDAKYITAREHKGKGSRFFVLLPR